MPLAEPPPAGEAMLPPGTYDGQVVLVTGHASLDSAIA